MPTAKFFFMLLTLNGSKLMFCSFLHLVLGAYFKCYASNTFYISLGLRQQKNGNAEKQAAKVKRFVVHK